MLILFRGLILMVIGLVEGLRHLQKNGLIQIMLMLIGIREIWMWRQMALYIWLESTTNGFSLAQLNLPRHIHIKLFWQFGIH